MSMNLFKKSKRLRDDAGIALITTLLLLFLMSSLLVGFTVLLMTNQQLAGSNNDDVTAFYGAEAGMEQMTANLGDLFSQTYSPTAAQINAVELNPPLIWLGNGKSIQFLNSNGTSGYTITPGAVDANGNPAPTIATIKSGPYSGMTALLTEYTMVVNARTTEGREAKLQRTVQTVGIPVFQFGIFSSTDLSFFPGPNFNFGGRTQTNGNLFLASGSSLTLSQPVTAFLNVIRTNLSNGFPTTTGSYGGSVNVFNGSGTRPLAYTEGSLTGTIGSPVNPGWSNISLGSANYAGNLRNGATGAQTLNLAIVTIGAGSTQPTDIIRRPIAGESASITTERYFAQASFRVLLSDNAADITSLPCIDTTVAPLELSQLAQPVAGWTAFGGNPALLYTKMNTNNTAGFSTLPVPLAASAAVLNAAAYNTADGYWVPGPTTAHP